MSIEQSIDSIFRLYSSFNGRKSISIIENEKTDGKLNLLIFFADLAKLEDLKYRPSFPYWSPLWLLRITAAVSI